MGLCPQRCFYLVAALPEGAVIAGFVWIIIINQGLYSAVLYFIFVCSVPCTTAVTWVRAVCHCRGAFARARERTCVCVCVYVCAHARACVYLYVYARARVCACACLCVCDKCICRPL